MNGKPYVLLMTQLSTADPIDCYLLSTRHIHFEEIETGEKMKGYVYVKDLKGHRGSYQDLFSKIFGFKKLSGALFSSGFRDHLSAPRAIFATIGINNSDQLLMILLRAVIGRSSCAIWLGEPFEEQERGSCIRRRDLWMLRILRRLNRVRLFSIYPFRTEDRRRRVVDDWIADPQLWDMTDLSTNLDSLKSSIPKEIRSDFSGKPVIAFLGRGSTAKNYPCFVDFAIAERNQIAAISVGPIDPECKQDAEKLSKVGGFIIDRFVDDAELLSIYSIADYVWCAYSELYDRPSGIYGRGIALGALPVVRAGSYLDEFSSEFGFDVERVSLENICASGNTDVDFRSVIHSDDRRKNTLDHLRELRFDAIRKISRALGCEPLH